MAVYQTVPGGRVFFCDAPGCRMAFASPREGILAAEAEAAEHGWRMIGAGHFCPDHPHGNGPRDHLSPETRRQITETIRLLNETAARINATLARLERGG